MTTINFPPDVVVREPITRAAKMLGDAMNKFLADEAKRDPDKPGWITIVAVAEALGIVLGGVVAMNPPDSGDIDESVDLLVELLKQRALEFIEWHYSGGQQP